MSTIFLFVFLNLSLNLSRVICHKPGECIEKQTNYYFCHKIGLSKLKEIPPTIERLTIHIANIPDVTDATFSRFSNSLVTLDCQNCKIRNIEPNAFKNMNLLKNLNLVNSKISSVNISWIQGLGNRLTRLSLRNNKIEKIDPDVFQYLDKVKEFILSGNPLKCLNLDEMSKMKKLRRLTMQSTPNFECPDALKNFTDSRRIKLDEDVNWIKKDIMSAYSNNTTEAIHLNITSSASTRIITLEINFFSFLLLISKTVFIDSL